VTYAPHLLPNADLHLGDNRLSLAAMDADSVDSCVLDPFCGSGSTGCAAVLEGRRFVGMDLSAEYLDISAARIAHWRQRRQTGLFEDDAP
jgi:methylase of polypeptide subunit release factors